MNSRESMMNSRESMMNNNRIWKCVNVIREYNSQDRMWERERMRRSMNNWLKK